jgi:preprotein translocase subunit YajC
VQSLFPLILLLLAFVVLIVLPQRQRKKQQAQQQALQESLVPGTPVMLTSGIHGTVAGIGEGTVDLQIAPGVVVTVARQAVLEVRQPAAGGPAGPLPGAAGEDAPFGGTADGTEPGTELGPRDDGPGDRAR